MAEKSTQKVRPSRVDRSFRIAGHRLSLSAEAVVSALSDVEPEPIQSLYVVVAGQRYPPKQVISVATGLDRADFTSHQARRTLMRLGFLAGRSGASGVGRPPVGSPSHGLIHAKDQLPERLRELAGLWVAVKGDDVLHSAESPQALVGWLTRHGQRADSMFRVPEDDVAATGLAPH